MLTDEELMERYRAGDRGAFAELFRRYAPLLLRIMQHRITRREDARDLVQQAFLQLHRSKDDFRQGALLRPWLFTIAMNLKHRHFRRRGRIQETPVEQSTLDEMNFTAWSMDSADAGCDVRALLAELPSEQREVIALHWLEGLSFDEVATVVGVSLSAVKVRAHRGYSAIRKVLAYGPSETELAPFREKGRNSGSSKRAQ
ncbi:MAG TPA: RNA polymerase sigma factor [Polyangiaceae bacterium]|nr:RNA polymerase sigma factor [Polyangiaceae bacterium]